LGGGAYYVVVPLLEEAVSLIRARALTTVPGTMQILQVGIQRLKEGRAVGGKRSWQDWWIGVRFIQYSIRVGVQRVHAYVKRALYSIKRALYSIQRAKGVVTFCRLLGFGDSEKRINESI